MSHIECSTSVVSSEEFQKDWQLFLSQPEVTTLIQVKSGQIEHYVNAKGLACPMPLLKLKMALKHVQVANHVYVTATDPNSQQDIGAFCQHIGYELLTASSTALDSTKTDTIFHLLITKNC